ncbi:MAG: Glycerol-3-phosphate dehydrogenase [NAD(P)+] [uncultured Phycisphaerae bacterium]|uniref:Glycerol-3-phosphate dehydrogenase [NAD(P)+] n=1 Tax=uncultured Phycisphaerae bacterium TaxID=904963 RepID=A0A6J4NE12_9BACT|nr:MAG: Glycerol-3-phosphate dehydrogenase [NAD(P)+] [uncultured Phycisphaerae bacterium]
MADQTTAATPTRERVTILGDGAMATVCSILLTQGGHEVTMWGAFEESIERLIQNREQQRLLPGARIPPGVRLTANDGDCFRGATMVLSAIPTQYMRSVWQRLGSRLPDGLPIASVAKGIENGTLLRPTQIIADVLGGRAGRPEGSEARRPGGSEGRREDGHALVALSGPNIAAELAKYLPGTAVIASEDLDVARRVQAAFATQWFRVYTNADVVGVELAGATKNVIAIAAGILDGLAAGNNAKAALVTRGLVEITRLGVAMGAKAETFGGLAGLGDLITTCVSPEGRNRTVGERIGKGQKLDDILGGMDSVAEGVPTTRAVRQLAVRYGVEMPITEAVHSVLFDGKDAIAALTDLMSRDPKPEHA